LRFLDGTKVMVTGLTEILMEFHAEGREATVEISHRILERLEGAKNHIPSSAVARREYAYVVLEEYKTHIAEQAKAAAAKR
jgi:hypothetical protein